MGDAGTQRGRGGRGKEDVSVQATEMSCSGAAAKLTAHRGYLAYAVTGSRWACAMGAGIHGKSKEQGVVQLSKKKQHQNHPLPLKQKQTLARLPKAATSSCTYESSPVDARISLRTEQPPGWKTRTAALTYPTFPTKKAYLRIKQQPEASATPGISPRDAFRCRHRRCHHRRHVVSFVLTLEGRHDSRAYKLNRPRKHRKQIYIEFRIERCMRRRRRGTGRRCRRLERRRLLSYE